MLSTYLLPFSMSEKVFYVLGMLIKFENWSLKKKNLEGSEAPFKNDCLSCKGVRFYCFSKGFDMFASGSISLLSQSISSCKKTIIMMRKVSCYCPPFLCSHLLVCNLHLQRYKTNLTLCLEGHFKKTIKDIST